jgi:hypothetical protein
MVSCPKCGGQELELVERLTGEARRLRCDTCGHDWVRGEQVQPQTPAATPPDPSQVHEFVDDDRGYLSFVQRRAGFVINSLRGWVPSSFVLHDATCFTITVDGEYMRSSPWTGHDYVKACATRKRDMLAWASARGNSDLHRCGVCDP